jgi:nucleotidyltransferase substrate binding protein (TIGR01987 family)
MHQEDIRWEQRYVNFKKAIAKMDQVVSNILPAQDDKDLAGALSELEVEGLIQRFEYTHELAWNVMKDYLVFQGAQNIGGPRDATREAFKIGLVQNGEGWMDMIKSRNMSSHTYNKSTAEAIYFKIVREYYPLFKDFEQKMESLCAGGHEDLFSKDV